MIAPFILFSLVGLGFFYLQNLVFFPHVRLDLLDLLIFFVGLRPSLSLSLSLALMLGLLQDSYAATPLGLHLGASLVLVASARFFRRRLVLQRIGSQVLATLGALILQEVWFQVIIVVLRFQSPLTRDLITYRGLEILATAALAPLMYQLVRGLERLLRLLGWLPLRDLTPFKPSA
ncbi:MAG: hypothetical protein Q8M54_12125 [Desulfobaccales bacterium]|nr:hypothetical protein [Desulfobaccales bacterium]